MTVLYKNFILQTKNIDQQKRIFSGIMTREVVDREAEVVKLDGINTKSFEQIGSLFFNHNHDMPLGKPIAMRKFTDRLEADFEMASKPADFVGEFYPDTFWALVQQGVIKGLSIGFIPVEKRNATKQDKKTYGEEVERVISKSNLMECSLATIPANAEAIITNVQKGLISKEIAVKYFNYKEEITEPQTIKVNINKKNDMERTISIAIKKAKGELYE